MNCVSAKPNEFVLALNKKYEEGASDDDIRHWLKIVANPGGQLQNLDDYQLRVLRKDFGDEAKERAKKAVKILEWFKLNPHLPEPPLGTIYRFLWAVKNSEEKCIKRMEKYYTLRATDNEIFCNRDLTTPQAILNQQHCLIGGGPRLTEDLNCVLYIRLLNCDAAKYDYKETVRREQTLADLFLNFDFSLGVIIVSDWENFTMQHLISHPLTLVQKVVTIIEDTLPSRVKQIHFTNCPPAMNTLLSLIRPLLSAKTSSRFHVHTGSLEKFYECIPKETTIEEYGGNAGSLAQIQERWLKSVEENREWLVSEEKMAKKIYQEAKMKSSQFKDRAEHFGMEGSFRKLDID